MSCTVRLAADAGAHTTSIFFATRMHEGISFPFEPRPRGAEDGAPEQDASPKVHSQQRQMPAGLQSRTYASVSGAQ